MRPTPAVALLLTVVLVGVSSVSGLGMAMNTPTFVESNIESDTTWTEEEGPYRVVSTVTVAEGATLTIEPGTDVRFATDVELTIRGSIQAPGGSDSVQFTSGADGKAPGDWNGIIVEKPGSARFENVEIQHATNGVIIRSPNQVTIKQSAFRNNSNAGLRIEVDGDLTVRNSVFAVNGNGITAADINSLTSLELTGVVLRNNNNHGAAIRGPGQITNMTIDNVAASNNGGAGITIQAAGSPGRIQDVTVTGSSFESNSGSGLVIHGVGENQGYTEFESLVQRVTIRDTRAVNNRGPGLRVRASAGADTHLREITLVKNNVTGNAHGIVVGADGGWKDNAYASGLTVRNNDAVANKGVGIQVYADAEGNTYGKGRLKSSTITANRIIDSGEIGLEVYAAGEVSGDGPNIVRGIIINSNYISGSARHGVSIHADSTPRVVSNEVTNLTSVDNGGSGLHLAGGGGRNNTIKQATLVANSRGLNAIGGHRLTVANSTLAQNDLHGALLSGVKATIEVSDIMNNTYGVNVTNGAVASAEGNYWGDTSGPYHPSINPKGAGNPVNGDLDSLDFIPVADTRQRGNVDVESVLPTTPTPVPTDTAVNRSTATPTETPVGWEGTSTVGTSNNTGTANNTDQNGDMTTDAGTNKSSGSSAPGFGAVIPMLAMVVAVFLLRRF